MRSQSAGILISLTICESACDPINSILKYPILPFFGNAVLCYKFSWVRWLVDKPHVCLLGSSAAFLDIAGLTAGNDVGPRCGSSQTFRYDMIKGEFFPDEFLPTVLTHFIISGIHIGAGKLDLE